MSQRRSHEATVLHSRHPGDDRQNHKLARERQLHANVTENQLDPSAVTECRSSQLYDEITRVPAADRAGFSLWTLHQCTHESVQPRE